MVTGPDITSLMAAFADLNSYQASKNLTAPQLLTLADVNHGKMDYTDVQALASLGANDAAFNVTIVSGSGQIATVPEPASAIMFTIAIVFFSPVKVRHRRETYSETARRITAKV